MNRKRNTNYNNSAKPLLLALFVLLIVGVYFYNQCQTPEDLDDGAILSRCIDGDTAVFRVKGEDVTVRFLGIDAPEYTTEKEEYGYEASHMTCDILSDAEYIKLEYEPNNRTDKYGRTLAWVFSGKMLVQEFLLREGLAEVKYINDDYKYIDKLYDSQKVAQDMELYIWSKK